MLSNPSSPGVYREPLPEWDEEEEAYYDFWLWYITWRYNWIYDSEDVFQ